MRHRFRFRILAAVGAVLVTLAAGATRARADVAPPDACTAPGQTCTNAGPRYDQAGTCVATTCTKQVPSPDGGSMSMTYDCNKCTAGGAGGSGGGGAGGSTSPPPAKSSGCAVAAGRGDAGSLALAVALGAIAGLLLAARRRNAGE
jgi:MYXO-CTERM domain-containing protein